MLNVLEELLGRNEGGFLLGNNPTIADLQIFFESTDEILMKRNFDDYPLIKRWFEKMNQIKEVKIIMDEWTATALKFAEILSK